MNFKAGLCCVAAALLIGAALCGFEHWRDSHIGPRLSFADIAAPLGVGRVD